MGGPDIKTSAYMDLEPKITEIRVRDGCEGSLVIQVWIAVSLSVALSRCCTVQL